MSAGGGGTWRATTANSRPTKPSGVQLAKPDLLYLIDDFNRSGDSTMVVPSEYVEVVVVKR